MYFRFWEKKKTLDYYIASKINKATNKKALERKYFKLLFFQEKYKAIVNKASKLYKIEEENLIYYFENAFVFSLAG